MPAEPIAALPPIAPPSPDAAARLIGRVGRLLLVNGADTGHAIARMHEAAALLGCDARLLVTPEAIVVATDDGEALRSRVGPAIPAMAVNMRALIKVEQAIDLMRMRRIDIDAVHHQLDAVEQRCVAYARWLVVLGVAVTAGSLARLFGAGWAISAAAFLAGIVSTILRLSFARRGWNPITAAFLTVLASGLVGEAAVWAAGDLSPVLCLTAAGMILVPGVPLLNGVRDLLDGHALSGIARLTLGGATVLAIGFALFVAAALAREALPVGDAPGSLPVAADLLFSATAAAGFALLFNVPWRAIPACILCGIASHGLRTALEGYGVDLAAASLIGALAAGLVARGAARFYRVPAVTFAFPGIVAMIPGSYGFRAGIGGLQLMTQGAAASPALIAETLSLVVTTIVVTIAIAIGLLIALADVFPVHPTVHKEP